jgi:hypothetical protein
VLLVKVGLFWPNGHLIAMEEGKKPLLRLPKSLDVQ